MEHKTNDFVEVMVVTFTRHQELCLQQSNGVNWSALVMWPRTTLYQGVFFNVHCKLIDVAVTRGRTGLQTWRRGLVVLEGPGYYCPALAGVAASCIHMSSHPHPPSTSEGRDEWLARTHRLSSFPAWHWVVPTFIFCAVHIHIVFLWKIIIFLL